MTKSEIKEEYRELRRRINRIDELISAGEKHIKELKKERFLICERIREVLDCRDDDYNPKLKSLTLVYREDLDIEDILMNGIGGVKI